MQAANDEQAGGLLDALTCPKCEGRTKILAAIIKADSVRAILDQLADHFLRQWAMGG